MVAAGVRNIKPGHEYEKFFSSPERKDPYWPHGSVYDTLELMQKVVNITLDQTKKIAAHLRANDLDTTCKNIWNFLFHHVQYKEDDRNVEQLRSPYRTWADRKIGVDCDCYSIFISSILTNLGIEHSLRITEYDNKGWFQHVFVVVPKDGKSLSGRSSYYVIDPVLDKYDYEKSFTKKHDKKMAIRHQFLNGVGTIPFGSEFEALKGLGRTVTTDDVNDALKLHLQNTLAIAKANPSTVMNAVDPAIFIKQLEYLLRNWNNPVARAAALEELAEMEDRGENTPPGTVSGLGCACRTGVAPTMPKQVALKKIDLLAKRRAAKPTVIPITYSRGNLVNNAKIHSLCQPYAASPSMNGLNGKFFSKIKTAVQNTTQKVKTAVQNTKDKVQTAVQNTKEKVQNVAEKAKDLAKKVVQQNPVTVSIRGGVLLAMKTNVFKMAERLKWGYLTEAEAVKRGFDPVEWKKVKAALDQTIASFTKLGGKPENLKNAILTGRAGGLSGTGLGAVAAASLMAAASAVIAKISGWLKNINNSKLFMKVKGGIAKAKELIASKLPGSETDVKNMVASDPTVTDEFTTEMTRQAEVEVDTSSAFTEQSQSRSASSGNGDEKTFLQKNGLMLLIGAAAVVGFGVAMSGGKKKTVNGLTPETKEVKI